MSAALHVAALGRRIACTALRTTARSRLERGKLNALRIQEGFALHNQEFISPTAVRDDVQFPARGRWASDAPLLHLGQFDAHAGERPVSSSLENRCDDLLKGVHSQAQRLDGGAFVVDAEDLLGGDPWPRLLASSGPGC